MVIIIYEVPTVIFKAPISFCHNKFRKIWLGRKHDYRKISGRNGISEKEVQFFLGRTSQTEIRVPLLAFFNSLGGGGVLVLPYMGYMGMCRCEGYGVQAVYSKIGYINQSVWV